MSQFLDAGSIGNGGVTIVVNGMEVSALNVSASAMQQIRINQDPYSAEYSRPGRGRVEILTKPGATAVSRRRHADLPQCSLNARNAVRGDQAAGTARIYEGFLGGPIGTSGKTSFMLSANDQILDQQSFIYAPDPTASSRTTCRTRAARRGSAAASRGRSATRTRSRSGRTTSTRATRIAASAARRWRARRARSSTTSSR